MPLTSAERVVLRHAIEPPGFVSERDLTMSQIRTARDLCDRKLLKSAGKESDGSKVYRATHVAKREFGE